MKSYLSMAFKPFLVSFVLISLLIVNIKGNIDTKPTEHPGHQRIIHLIKRSSLKIRESENNQVNCTKLNPILHGDWAECNKSLHMAYTDVNQYLDNKEKIPDDVLTTINNGYSKFCIAKCSEPLLKYWQCLSTGSGDELTSATNYLHSYSCGRQNGDFCPALYLRHYATINNIFYHVYEECEYEDSGYNPIICSNPTLSCKNNISRLNENFGCCTQASLGDLSACNIDSLDEPCNSAISSGTNIDIAPAFVTISLIITIVCLQFSPFFN